MEKVCGFFHEKIYWVFMGSSDSDRQLVAQYLEGKRGAAHTIEKYISLALTPFRSRLHSHLSDISQDVHISLLGIFRNNEFRFESSLKHFVGRVAVNRALTLIDFFRVRDAEVLGDDVEVSTDDENPEESLMRRERWAQIVTVVRLASRECRRLWRMVLREGLNYAEIARREGKSEETIKWRLFTCREQARKNMDRLQKYSNLLPAGTPRSM